MRIPLCLLRGLLRRVGARACRGRGRGRGRRWASGRPGGGRRGARGRCPSLQGSLGACDCGACPRQRRPHPHGRCLRAAGRIGLGGRHDRPRAHSGSCLREVPHAGDLRGGAARPGAGSCGIGSGPQHHPREAWVREHAPSVQQRVRLRVGGHAVRRDGSHLAGGLRELLLVLRLARERPKRLDELVGAAAGGHGDLVLPAVEQLAVLVHQARVGLGLRLGGVAVGLARDGPEVHWSRHLERVGVLELRPQRGHGGEVVSVFVHSPPNQLARLPHCCPQRVH
mmetsp:Transcript_24271/g.91592  ORF Transcript_24271/g.91592 Transcript_24271/m.91592 type:complete len:282 (+) Transcript_24271:2759-3604(+)